MTEQHSPPKEPYDDRQQNDRAYAEQVAGVLKTVGKQKPELLWILLLVVVIEGAQLYETAHRVVATQAIMGKVTDHIATVEANRQEENRRMQDTAKLLVQTPARRTDRIERAMAEPTPGE